MAELNPKIQKELVDLKAVAFPEQVTVMNSAGVTSQFVKVQGLLITVLTIRRINPTLAMMMTPQEQTKAISQYIKSLAGYCHKLLQGNALTQYDMQSINEINQSVYKKGA